MINFQTLSQFEEMPVKSGFFSFMLWEKASNMNSYSDRHHYMQVCKLIEYFTGLKDLFFDRKLKKLV